MFFIRPHSLLSVYFFKHFKEFYFPFEPHRTSQTFYNYEKLAFLNSPFPISQDKLVKVWGLKPSLKNILKGFIISPALLLLINTDTLYQYSNFHFYKMLSKNSSYTIHII